MCHPPTIPSSCLLVNSQWCRLVIPRSWQMLAIRNEGHFNRLCTRTVIRYLENNPLPLKPLSDSLHTPFLLLSFRTSCENERPILVQSFAAQTLRSVYIYVYEEQTFTFLAASLFTSREQTGLWHSGFAVGSQDHHFSTQRWPVGPISPESKKRHGNAICAFVLFRRCFSLEQLSEVLARCLSGPQGAAAPLCLAWWKRLPREPHSPAMFHSPVVQFVCRGRQDRQTDSGEKEDYLLSKLIEKLPQNHLSWLLVSSKMKPIVVTCEAGTGGSDTATYSPFLPPLNIILQQSPSPPQAFLSGLIPPFPFPLGLYSRSTTDSL